MQGEWQPIETAPKDGSEILACNCAGDIDVVMWESPENWLTPDEEYEGCQEDEYAWHLAHSGRDRFIKYELLYWMPLPTLPQSVLQSGAVSGAGGKSELEAIT